MRRALLVTVLTFEPWLGVHAPDARLCFSDKHLQSVPDCSAYRGGGGGGGGQKVDTYKVFLIPRDEYLQRVHDSRFPTKCSCFRGWLGGGWGGGRRVVNACKCS